MDNIYRSPCKAWVVKVVISLLPRITSFIPFDICRSLYGWFSVFIYFATMRPPQSVRWNKSKGNLSHR